MCTRTTRRGQRTLVCLVNETILGSAEVRQSINMLILQLRDGFLCSACPLEYFLPRKERWLLFALWRRQRDITLR